MAHSRQMRYARSYEHSGISSAGNNNGLFGDPGHQRVPIPFVSYQATEPDWRPWASIPSRSNFPDISRPTRLPPPHSHRRASGSLTRELLLPVFWRTDKVLISCIQKQPLTA
jgi:hypothetical protein